MYHFPLRRFMFVGQPRSLTVFYITHRIKEFKYISFQLRKYGAAASARFPNELIYTLDNGPI